MTWQDRCNKTCMDQTSIKTTLYAPPVSPPLPPLCQAGTKCPSGVGCVAASRLCDGLWDCADGSDEDAGYCRAFDCAATFRVRLAAGWMSLRLCAASFVSS